MTSIDDIEAERDRAARILSGLIHQARAWAQAGKAGLDDKITLLEAKRQAVCECAADQALDGPELDHALAALKKAADALNDAAQRMTDATAFLRHAAELVNAADGMLKLFSAAPAPAPHAKPAAHA